MVSPPFTLLARGFIGGAVVTVSISYAIFKKQLQMSPCSQPPSVKDDARFPFGKPVDLRQVIDYAEHTLYYDAARKQPLWAAEVFTAQSLKGTATRKKCKFRRDVQIPEEYSAENSDFANSGWSRGHMAPAGDFQSSQVAMDDSFYLTNIVPQNMDNNSGFWNRFEMYCRDLTKKFEKVHVITGPLYQTNMSDEKKNYVQYEVIGNDRVPAPTHLYKLVVGFGQDTSKPALGAFVVPNIPIPSEQGDLVDFQVSREDLQALTGFTFLPALSADNTTNLCTTNGNSCQLKNMKDIEIYFVRKKIENAASQQDIDAAMAHLQKKNIKLDKKTLTLVQSKEAELKNGEVATRDSRRA